MQTEYEFRFGGERLVALSSRALWWPAEKTLMIADLHAGKTEHFQRSGIALPSGSLRADLDRLSLSIQSYGATRLLILGDLFHSVVNSEWQQFSDWCQAQTCTIELVRGNHDRFITDAQLVAAGIEVHTEPYRVGRLILSHHPPEGDAPTEAWICGHLHPVHRVHGPGRDVLRLASFWISPRRLVMPAFGSFTGGVLISRYPMAQIVCVAPDFSCLFVSRADS